MKTIKMMAAIGVLCTIFAAVAYAGSCTRTCADKTSASNTCDTGYSCNCDCNGGPAGSAECSACEPNS